MKIPRNNLFVMYGLPLLLALFGLAAHSTWQYVSTARQGSAYLSSFESTKAQHIAELRSARTKHIAVIVMDNGAYSVDNRYYESGAKEYGYSLEEYKASLEPAATVLGKYIAPYFR